MLPCLKVAITQSVAHIVADLLDSSHVIKFYFPVSAAVLCDGALPPSGDGPLIARGFLLLRPLAHQGDAIEIL